MTNDDEDDLGPTQRRAAHRSAAASVATTLSLNGNGMQTCHVIRIDIVKSGVIKSRSIDNGQANVCVCVCLPLRALSSSLAANAPFIRHTHTNRMNYTRQNETAKRFVSSKQNTNQLQARQQQPPKRVSGDYRSGRRVESRRRCASA